MYKDSPNVHLQKPETDRRLISPVEHYTKKRPEPDNTNISAT